MSDIINIPSNLYITFPKGAISGSSKVLFVKKYIPDQAKVIILVEETPFHPIDHAWPDQPGDVGTIVVEGDILPVEETLTGAINKLGEFYLDKDIPVKRGEAGWIFGVAHIVSLPSKYELSSLVGKIVSLNVNPIYRKKLSASHSSCHLTALALNKCTRDLWRKDVFKDSLHNPNLDQLSIQSSVITPSESIDHYRFGKSLRKKGFNSTDFIERAKEIELCIHQQLENWLKTGQQITIEAPDPTTLDSRRTWRCELPDGVVSIPCGGTHLSSLSEIKSIKVSFELDPVASELTIHTVPELHHE